MATVLYRRVSLPGPARSVGTRLLAGLLCLSICRASIADEPPLISVEAQRLDLALLELAEEANVQIAFAPGAAMKNMAPAVRNAPTFPDAIDQILDGTGLYYKYVSDNFVVVRERRPAALPASLAVASGPPAYSTLLAQLQESSQSGNRRDTGAQAADETDSTVARSRRTAIEEIIVTATKRSENVQSVATSIAVISDMDIARKELVSMIDYVPTVPGVFMQDRGAGRNSVSIRGVVARPQSDRNVGIYIGETPIGAQALFGNADIKLIDMDRVEILRGPQGTLYGSSSISGTIRSIPAAPNLQEFGGRIAANYSLTAGNGDDNTMIQGVLNVPVVEDRLAVRAVAYRFENSGVFENRAASYQQTADLAVAFGAPELAANDDDIGRDEYVGGRISMLWQPTDRFRATASYLTQDLTQEGFPEEWMDVGEFQQARLQLIPLQMLEYLDTAGGVETLRDDTDVGNVLLELDLGWGQVISSSSWFEELSMRNTDVSVVWAAPVTQPQARNVDAFMQEVRLASQFDGAFQFLAGIYYEDVESDGEFTNFYAGDPALNPRSELEFFTGDGESTQSQIAYFGELSYTFADKLEATFGGRWFSYDKWQRTTNTGAVPVDSTTILDSEESDDTYKVNFSYTPGDRTLLYAQWVEGFRLGTPQAPLIRPDCDLDMDGFIDGTTISTGVSDIKSDTLESFELGGKFTLLDGRMVFNVAAYRINWTDIPIRVLFPCGAQTNINAGGAKSQGAELETTVLITEDFRFDFGASYVDATLTENALDLGQAGDRLPGSPRLNYNLGAEYDFDISNRPSYLRADWTYAGGLYNNFQQTGIETSDYHMINGKFGITFGSVDVSLFGKNLLNEDDLTYIQEIFVGRRAYRLRPRTIGLELQYRF